MLRPEPGPALPGFRNSAFQSPGYYVKFLQINIPLLFIDQFSNETIILKFCIRLNAVAENPGIDCFSVISS